VHYDKTFERDGEFQPDVLRKVPRRVIFDPENDVLLLRRPGLSDEDISVLREEEEEEEEEGLGEGGEQELSEEEIDDDESDKLINDSEVMYWMMAVISKRLGFHVQRVRHSYGL
jgi:hypothetical protein